MIYPADSIVPSCLIFPSATWGINGFSFLQSLRKPVPQRRQREDLRTSRGWSNRRVARCLGGFRRLGVWFLVHRFLVPSPAVPSLVSFGRRNPCPISVRVHSGSIPDPLHRGHITAGGRKAGSSELAGSCRGSGFRHPTPLHNSQRSVGVASYPVSSGNGSASAQCRTRI